MKIRLPMYFKINKSYSGKKFADSRLWIRKCELKILNKNFENVFWAKNGRIVFMKSCKVNIGKLLFCNRKSNSHTFTLYIIIINRKMNRQMHDTFKFEDYLVISLNEEKPDSLQNSWAKKSNPRFKINLFWNGEWIAIFKVQLINLIHFFLLAKRYFESWKIFWVSLSIFSSCRILGL